MGNPPQKKELFLNYYTQVKQRIDLKIDMNSQKVIGLTKLKFISRNDIYEEMPESLFLCLNGENMHIKDIKIDIDNRKNKDNENNILMNLEFKNTSPNYYYKNYLDQLYENIEEIDSFKNINRIEWEIRQKGNLIIKIPKKYIIDKLIKNIDEEKNKLNSFFLIKKIKIIINYELIEKNIGIIFQEFYESRKNLLYKICYTPNFYYNTQYWIPCIYNLELQIKWSLFIYISKEYISYSSCLLNKIIENEKGERLIISKTNESTAARNIGFIIINEKIFKRFYEQNNKNFIIVGNENIKEKIEKNLINNKLIETLYNYYQEFFDINLNSNLTSIIFIPYILFNNPFESFKKFLKSKEENYLNFIKFPNLYILPEKYIYNDSIPEISKFQLRNLSKIFINNYIGGLIIEKTYADFWIINSLETWLSDLFLDKVFNSYYIKYKLYKWLLKLEKICKRGKENLPLYNNNFSNPIDIQLNPIFYLKSKILFHILESKIDRTLIQKTLRNIINERHKKGYNISTEYLFKILKKNSGINLNYFMDLYIYKTGMFKIDLNYIYNQKTNSINIKIHQEQIAKLYYENHPFLNIKGVNFDFLKKMGKNLNVIDYRTKPNTYLNIFLNLDIIQTNGIEIKKDVHKIKLIYGKENFTLNLPLTIKFKKNELKKREQEFIQDLILNTGINKIYNNEEIEKILSQNSVLWIRADSELSSLRINQINQQHILYDYIKIFKEEDCLGQMESLYNIGKNEKNFENSIIILKNLIKCNNNIYYKVKQYALKIYMKIILKLNKEEEFEFLLEMLENYYNELLKNKTKINMDIYYLMKDIIKHLGEYKETNFRKFSLVGLFTNSPIQNKIIDKFLSILISNELNVINGYDNCYLMADIIMNISKFNLQEKSIILLEKILKNLRIEKLKRSENEITIISTLNALINLLIKNDFFFTHIKYFKLLFLIFKELNYYINDNTENYELYVFFHYFQIFMNFYKSHSFIEFSNYLIKFVLGEEYNNTSKMAYFSMKKNLNMIGKIKALNYLFNNNLLFFDSFDDKIVFLSSLKIILYSPICYLRGDCRQIIENLYQIFYLLDISVQGAGNNNFNNINFLHLLNKNRINFSSKKYVDEEHLYNFINEDLISINSEDKSIMSDNSNIYNFFENYNMKYKNDEYALLNNEINFDINKGFNEILIEIVDKLLKHPKSGYFRNELNKENLKNLYEKNIKIISEPIDLFTIKNKILDNCYKNFMDFNKDIILMFNNCKKFNQKNSNIYNNGIHLEDYYKMLIYPIKKLNENNKNELLNNKKSIIYNEEIKLNDNDIIIDKFKKYNDQENINNNFKFDNKLNINNNEILNRKRDNKTKIINKIQKKNIKYNTINKDDNDNIINLKEYE